MILEQDDCGQLHEWFIDTSASFLFFFPLLCPNRDEPTVCGHRLNLEGNWELCYRGTRDGFRAFNFHQLCDGAHPSLTIIKTTTGQVLGGTLPLDRFRCCLSARRLTTPFSV
jgi:hypothetical protein